VTWCDTTLHVCAKILCSCSKRSPRCCDVQVGDLLRPNGSLLRGRVQNATS
jgi:hypothetical protein